MEFDNDRSRFAGGFDAGVIVDGVVTDLGDGRLILVDEDEVGFDPNVALSSLVGKRVRMTVASFDAMEVMESMLSRSQS